MGRTRWLSGNKPEILPINMLLRIYNSERYLATAKHDTTTTQIEDFNISHNAECIQDAMTPPNIIDNVKMIAADMLSASDGCMQCGHLY